MLIHAQNSPKDSKIRDYHVGSAAGTGDDVVDDNVVFLSMQENPPISWIDDRQSKTDRNPDQNLDPSRILYRLMRYCQVCRKMALPSPSRRYERVPLTARFLRSRSE